ncbi:hypothetical protein C8J56DRAFT_172180 [Mycena floridula]|nr:hypothetical protein C8J56DRAFT_172180 [Mycena floridula]
MMNFGENIGAKDLVRVPATREICRNATESETLNIWAHSCQNSAAGRVPRDIYRAGIPRSDEVFDPVSYGVGNGYEPRNCPGLQWSLWSPIQRRYPSPSDLLDLVADEVPHSRIKHPLHRCTLLVYISILGTALIVAGNILDLISTLANKATTIDAAKYWTLEPRTLSVSYDPRSF